MCHVTHMSRIWISHMCDTFHEWVICETCDMSHVTCHTNDIYSKPCHASCHTIVTHMNQSYVWHVTCDMNKSYVCRVTWVMWHVTHMTFIMRHVTCHVTHVSHIRMRCLICVTWRIQVNVCVCACTYVSSHIHIKTTFMHTHIYTYTHIHIYLEGILTRAHTEKSIWTYMNSNEP